MFCSSRQARRRCRRSAVLSLTSLACTGHTLRRVLQPPPAFICGNKTAPFNNQHKSNLAQRKRAGLITRRSLDRNEELLLYNDFFSFFFLLVFSFFFFLLFFPSFFSLFFLLFSFSIPFHNLTYCQLFSQLPSFRLLSSIFLPKPASIVLAILPLQCCPFSAAVLSLSDEQTPKGPP